MAKYTGPRLIVFASGSKTGGGSGFEKLVENTRKKILQAKIVAVVSNHENGGVRERADRLGIRFHHFHKPRNARLYRNIVEYYGAHWVALSGWLKLARGLNPARTINIHPGPLPDFGGIGWHGHAVHEGVLTAYRKGRITHSAVSMHFVTPEYDQGPVFFEYPVPIHEDDTASTLGARVNAVEHEYQSLITNMVIHEQIRWDGKNPNSLQVPHLYEFLPRQKVAK